MPKRRFRSPMTCGTGGQCAAPVAARRRAAARSRRGGRRRVDPFRSMTPAVGLRPVLGVDGPVQRHACRAPWPPPPPPASTGRRAAGRTAPSRPGRPCVMAWLVRTRSARISATGRRPRSTSWCQLWLQSWCPSRTIRADQLRVLADLGADHAERRLHLGRPELVEHPRRPGRVGPVVEGQRHRAYPGRRSADPAGSVWSAWAAAGASAGWSAAVSRPAVWVGSGAEAVGTGAAAGRTCRG